MVVKNVIVKGKKVSIRTHNEANGKTRIYALGKTKVFFDVKVTSEGFRATAVARDGRVGTMDIIIDRKGKMVGVTIDHPKVDLNIINTKNEVTISVKKK